MYQVLQLFPALKNNIQLNKFESLVGFTVWLMNWASSHLVKRKVFQGAPVQYGWLLQAEAGWDKKVIIKRKEGIDSVKVTFIWDTDSKGFTDYIINVGQEIPDWLLKIPLQTGVETAIQS